MEYLDFVDFWFMLKLIKNVSEHILILQFRDKQKISSRICS